ncbi:BcsR/BcsP family cellulose biosynthesis protein [Gluconobacter kondonii]|uniref:BcsR/BcsP family cellulose biosynthesis protein n=1 Tax=Gluconobacter kondonii TaxID=941463 RepID=UPI0038D2428F
MDYKKNDVSNVLELFGVDNFTYQEIYDRESFSVVERQWPLLNEILHRTTGVVSDVKT